MKSLEEEISSLMDEVGKLLSGLSRSLTNN